MAKEVRGSYTNQPRPRGRPTRWAIVRTITLYLGSFIIAVPRSTTDGVLKLVGFVPVGNVCRSSNLLESS